ncbi:hypothetical protein [Sulfurimonas sp.]|jgi:ABC-type phosphate transport system substrate-binding protein|uniref:hypothetical protein n=1 Tax=Sulfurimonas sp. TaxID=2022749 RepID=UPI0025D18CD8|nr:hypothetical protein [Sulfurimonas sp.]MBT5934364.1 hypothetical protein [Sulfurimonas sp.]
MKHIFLILFILFNTLHANSFDVLVNDSFPLKSLSKKQLKSIYLKKVTYISGVKIFAINISSSNHLRREFEKMVLVMNPQNLKNYWQKAHYKGIRPPKVLKSNKNILSYLSSVEGAIAYVPKGIAIENLHVLKVED